MNVSLEGNEQITSLLNDWYVEIRARHIENAHLLKKEIDEKIENISHDESLSLYYFLLDFRYKYVIDNLNVSKDSFDKIESYEIPEDSLLTYYYHFFKAIHASTIGNYNIARENYEKAEGLLDIVPDELEKAEFYYKLGAFHYDVYESLQSIKYVTKAKEMFLEQENHERNTGFCENLLGMACINLKEWVLAEEHLVKAMDIFQKLKEDKFILMVRHNLGLLYASQNLSELAIRHLSEVSQKKPNHYKAMYVEAKEHLKLKEYDTAASLIAKGHKICTELGNEEYHHHFEILNALNEDIPTEKLEKIILAGISYFEKEALYEYIQECQEQLAKKFYEESNHIKSSEYFYLSTQARQKAFDKEALK
ncbi:Rap family tetratricopeptide repeat protein [Bacillus pseudomycoides]|uniref:Rap family tetratricopeptide repeat protein n=1 Tax=Bacillus bingmayongensis TaxID=1150157 RepID=A0ABU5JRV7_9BACI|nr:Rap family tetratricopeptide repeat protein [Bacillus pseudomycoides]